MKVICDVHIPLRLVNFLNSNGIQAEHVNSLPDTFYTSDKAICEYVDKNTLVIITKDIDFRNSYYIRNSPKRLIRICLGNISTTELVSIIHSHVDFLKNTYNTFTRFYIEINRDNLLVVSS